MKKSLLKTISLFLIFLAGNDISAQSFNANFGISDSCRTITISDSSTGANNQYFWSFGDGSYASEQNPQHTFYINGNYTITLILVCQDSSSGNFLRQDTLAQQISINCAECNIKPEFSWTRDLTTNLKIHFTNLTTGQTTYNSSWNFGYFGAGSPSQNPVHTFPSTGLYYVKLVTWYHDASLSRDCIDSIIKEIAVSDIRADFTYSIDSTQCTTVQFTPTQSTAQHYIWEFGDGGTSVTVSPKYTYSIGTGVDTQVFNVRLRIYSYDSVAGYFSDTIIKQVILPPCNICQINANIQLDGDSTVPFSGTLYNYSTGKTNKHHWDFGDGGTSTSNAPIHSYANPGTYTITYIAMDTIKNCTDTTWVTFTIDSAGFLKRQVFTLTVIDKTTTGITKLKLTEKQALKAYPNPANSYILLKGTEQKITIYNILGIRMGEYEIHSDEPLNINTSGWAKGLYIILGDHKEKIKLIIE